MIQDFFEKTRIMFGIVYAARLKLSAKSLHILNSFTICFQ